MKKINLLLVTILSFLFVFPLTGCSLNKNKKSSETYSRTYSLSLSYMEDLMIDNTNVTAYGIKKSSNSSQINKVSLMNVSLVNDKKEENNNTKYYLYKTTENYEYGNVEYNENTITRVTFKKNSSVTEDVYDKNGNLIDSSTEITQDEIDAQINKIYTTSKYTFMQFIIIVNNDGVYSYYDEQGNLKSEKVYVRPTSLVYDENGVADFDKTDYYSSNLTASFVIDNSTGYIYKIDGIYIKSFKNDLIVDDKGYYYTIKTDSNNNLIFTDVMPNKDIKVENVFTDKYGWVYVLNDTMKLLDSDNEIIYLRGVSDIPGYNQTDGVCMTKLYYDNDDIVYIGEYYGVGVEYCKLKYKIVDGKLENVNNNKLISGLYSIDVEGSPYRFSAMYKDLYIVGSPKNEFVLSTNLIYTYERENKLIVDIGYNGSYRWFDENYDFLLLIGNDGLYYKNIDLEMCCNEVVNITVSDFIKFTDKNLTKVEDYYLTVGDDQYKQINVYKENDFYTTKYYKVIRENNELKLVELNSKSYDDNIFIFQPINK